MIMENYYFWARKKCGCGLRPSVPMSISVHIWVDLHFKTENGSIDQTWENKEGHFVSLVLIYGLFDQVMTILRLLEVVRHVTK